MKPAKREIVTLKVRATVTQDDIDGGISCDANRCMGKVAMARELDRQFPEKGKGHKVRVDAGHIKANINGYRWLADTPRILAKNLKIYDKEKRRRAAGLPCTVEPFEYNAMFRRQTKIKPSRPVSAARRRQIVAARKAREAATGIPDRSRYTLRARLVGFQ